jgi:hypothetical protein
VVTDPRVCARVQIAAAEQLRLRAD